MKRTDGRYPPRRFILLYRLIALSPILIFLGSIAWHLIKLEWQVAHPCNSTSIQHIQAIFPTLQGIRKCYWSEGLHRGTNPFSCIVRGLRDISDMIGQV